MTNKSEKTRIAELESEIYRLNEKINNLEYQKHGIQCVLHDCFITLLENKIVKPSMKFYSDILAARDL